MQLKDKKVHYLSKSVRFSFALGLVISLFEASSFIFKTQRLIIIIGIISYIALSTFIGFLIGAVLSLYSKFVRKYEKLRYLPPHSS